MNPSRFTSRIASLALPISSRFGRQITPPIGATGAGHASFSSGKDAPPNIHGDWEAGVTSKAMKKRLVRCGAFGASKLAEPTFALVSTQAAKAAADKAAVADQEPHNAVMQMHQSSTPAIPGPPPPPPTAPPTSPFVVYGVLGVGFGLAASIVRALLG